MMIVMLLMLMVMVVSSLTLVMVEVLLCYLFVADLLLVCWFAFFESTSHQLLASITEAIQIVVGGIVMALVVMIVIKFFIGLVSLVG